MRKVQVGTGVMIGEERVHQLLFADDLVLFAHTEVELQRTLESFEIECHRAGTVLAHRKPKLF